MTNAPLYHVIRGSGPVLLLMLGGAADADAAGAFVDCLSHAFTVITYDRRGQARSPLERPDQRIEIETHGGDAHELLAALTDQPAYVFGSSIGALIALDLALRFPHQVSTVVAHEPPLSRLLPEAERPATSLVELYRREGKAAINTFAASIGIDRSGIGVKLADHSKATSNLRFFLEQDAPAAGRYNLDLNALKRPPTRIVVAGGSAGRQYFPYKSAARLGELLKIEFVQFPGPHAGYVSDAHAFAIRLEQLLRSDDRIDAAARAARSGSLLQGTMTGMLSPVGIGAS